MTKKEPTKTVKESTHKLAGKSFDELLKAEIEAQDPDTNWLILKKKEFQGKLKRGAKTADVPFVLRLEHAGTTTDAVARYIRKGWPVVYTNFIEAPTLRGPDGRPKRDERVEAVKALVSSLLIQSQATIESAEGIKAKYQERISENG